MVDAKSKPFAGIVSTRFQLPFTNRPSFNSATSFLMISVSCLMLPEKLATDYDQPVVMDYQDVS